MPLVSTTQCASVPHSAQGSQDDGTEPDRHRPDPLELGEPSIGAGGSLPREQWDSAADTESAVIHELKSPHHGSHANSPVPHRTEHSSPKGSPMSRSQAGSPFQSKSPSGASKYGGMGGQDVIKAAREQIR